jgi:hypothetical protein
MKRQIIAGLALLTLASPVSHSLETGQGQGPVPTTRVLCEFNQYISDVARKCAAEAIRCVAGRGNGGDQDCVRILNVVCEDGEEYKGEWKETDTAVQGTKRVRIEGLSPGQQGDSKRPLINITLDDAQGNPATLEMTGHKLEGYCSMDPVTANPVIPPEGT